MIISYIVYILILGIMIYLGVSLIIPKLEEIKIKMREDKEDAKIIKTRKFYEKKYPEIFESALLICWYYDYYCKVSDKEISKLHKDFIYAPNERVEQKIINEIQRREKLLDERRQSWNKKGKVEFNILVEKLKATKDEDFIYWFKNFYAKEWF